ncbi:hypothetical protein AWENTII_012786 [Aspergillus wentii]
MGESLDSTNQGGALDKFFDCKICNDIWRRFEDPKSTHEISLGRQDAASSKCPRHTPLVEQFKEYCGDERQCDDMGIREGYGEGSLCIIESLSDFGIYWDLLLVKQDSDPGHVGTGRILDPDWADLDIVKRWKTQCLSSHGAKCHNPMKIWPTRPAWLIDVEDKCVIPGQDCGPFVALSYSHGEPPVLKVDANDMVKLQEPLGLENPEISKYLSPEIRHGICLTSAIGERYLWADGLCIVDGHSATTEAQSDNIGAIYASAIVTLIAADGHSKDGIPGLKDVSPPRKLEQRVIPFGNEKIIVRNTTLFSIGGGTPYYEDGRTYQDYKMSPRKILFHNKAVHWECQCSQWHEELTPGDEVYSYLDPRLAVMLAGFPDIEALSHTISNYNRQEIIYDEDALPGFQGILSVLSRSFTGGFLHGLPEMLFDRALGWKPHWSHTNLRRRRQSKKSSNIQLALPSWSWAGWQGMVHTSAEAANINHRQDTISETIPITEWYTSKSPSDSPLRRIRSTWYENRDSYKDFTKPLPAGWTRYDVPADRMAEDQPWLHPDGCGDYFFKYSGMPEEDYCHSWYFPFPVPDIQDCTPPFSPEQTTYLFCKTKKAHIWAKRSGKYNILNLCTRAGDEIGKLHLHNEEQLALFPENVADGEPGTQVELVAIYRLKLYAKTFNMEEEKCTFPLRSWERYEVLWVEWKEGVAYRLAIGHVQKKRLGGIGPGGCIFGSGLMDISMADIPFSFSALLTSFTRLTFYSTSMIIEFISISIFTTSSAWLILSSCTKHSSK